MSFPRLQKQTSQQHLIPSSTITFIPTSQPPSHELLFQLFFARLKRRAEGYITMATIATADQPSLPTTLSHSPSKDMSTEDHNACKSSTEATTLTTFTCFPLLPVELRLKIWGYVACCEPKVIDITPNQIFYLDSATGKYCTWDSSQVNHPPLPDSKIFICYETYSRARTHPPQFLHVSRKSRNIGFEFYHPRTTTQRILGCFNVSVNHPGIPNGSQTSIWVNWTTNTPITKAPLSSYMWRRLRKDTLSAVARHILKFVSVGIT